MTLIYLMFALPAVALAGINVEITGTINDNNSKPQVHVSGREKSIITDDDIYNFNLNDFNVKRGVDAYNGRWPEDIYVRSPTPWGDLYQSYGWHQVKRTVRPKRAKILRTYVRPVVVHSQVFENDRPTEMTNSFDMSWVVENTVSSTWSESHMSSSGVAVDYKFSFIDVGTYTSYTSQWGKSTYKSESITLGASTYMAFTLKPYEKVTADLTASRGIVKVEIEYEISLSGHVAVNYNPTHKGHHFWALSIDEVMSSAGLPYKKTIREIIEIAVYSNGRVVRH